MMPVIGDASDPDECTRPEACGVCHECQRQQPCPIHPPRQTKEQPG
jgi:hypothetical protein